MEEVLSTPRFAASKRYPALLRYVVEKTLCGETENLKERTIGIEVFHRPPNYDTSSDTIVRYTAGEVRKRLSLYYHEAGADSVIKIELPSGSYIPEFYIAEAPSEPASTTFQEPLPPPSGTTTHRKYRPLFIVWASILLCAALTTGVIWEHHALDQPKSIFDAFWAPVFSMKKGENLLICPGAVVFSSTERTGVAPAQSGKQDPLISSETARSISQLTDLLGMKHVPFVLRLPPNVTRYDLQDHSLMLIGAYSNELTMQAVSHLRYRFSEQPTQSIYDSTQPSVSWVRPRSWLNEPGNDYGLLTRVQDPGTGKYTIIIAGLGRSGTEATMAFITSPKLMQLLAARLPEKWDKENLEVVLRTEVRDAQPFEPIVEAVWVWK